MSLNTAVIFGKASDEWSTPIDFYECLDAEFGFVLDAAATSDNTLVGFPYYGPDHPYMDGALGGPDALVGDWAKVSLQGAVFLNPPYSRCREFIAKAAQEARRGCTVVCLVPSRTDTRWWHSDVWDASTNACRPGVEVRFVKGRLKFGDGKNSAPFPSVVIVFRPVTA